jgi:hypothetical protein
MPGLSIEELGEFIILHQLLLISSEKARRILERQEDKVDRSEDRIRLEKVAVGLDLAENDMRSIIRRISGRP